MIVYTDKTLDLTPAGKAYGPADAVLAGGTAVVPASGAGFADGKAIGGFGGKGKKEALFKVEASAAGPLQLSFFYSNTSMNSEKLKYSVNGKSGEFQLMPTYSAQSVEQTGETIYLKQGGNEVRLYTDGGPENRILLGPVSVQ